jgi:UDPglucose 6-dehydrogenase
MSTISVIGDWQNAWVTAACLASFGHKVTLVSRMPELSLHEPYLDQIVERTTAAGTFRRIHPEQHTDGNVQDEYGWIALDTPLDEEGGPNVDPVKLAAIRACIRCEKIIVSSQVPLGFCQKLEENLRRPVAYVPENMRLGAGVEMFMSPDRVVIGASDRAYGQEIAEIFRPILLLPMLVDLPTAEMIKHATNAFLATSISLVNELARVGRPFDVDMRAVEQALKADSRIGPKAYVRAGGGFAGGTLERDLKALQRVGPLPRDRHDRPTRLIDAVLAVNAELPHPWASSCRCQACWQVSRD